MLNEPSFPFLEILGIVAFALSGISVAKASGLDIVGTYFCAVLTALGGGTVRDILIDHRPLYWVKHEWILLLIFCLCIGSYAQGVQRLNGPLSRFAWVADAVGTGIFALSGLVLALARGFGPLSAILMSLITAIVGGALRDITCGQIPHAFKRSELCATCALAGCITYFCTSAIGIPFVPGFVFSAATTAALRYLALVKRVMLPW